MRIAILELAEQHRMSGVDTWVKHLLANWRGGDEVEHVRWRPPGPYARASMFRDLPYRTLRGTYAQRVAQLREYDLGVLSNITLQRPVLPKAHQAFLESGIPWTGMIHGHHESHLGKTEALTELFNSPRYIGFVLTTSGGMVAELEPKCGRALDYVELPYLPYRRRGGTEVAEGAMYLYTGALALGKGLEAMIRGIMGSGRDLLCRGTATGGRYGRPDLLLWEKLRKQFPEAGWPEVNVFHKGEWEYRLPTGESAMYRGPYGDPREAYRVGALHLNLTNTTHCVDHLEYTTLEAMDYGLPVLVPEAQVRRENPYLLATVPYQTLPTSDLEVLRGALREAGELDHATRVVRVAHNRRQLVELHDPVSYTASVQEALTR